MTGKVAAEDGPVDTADPRWFTANVLAQALTNGYSAPSSARHALMKSPATLSVSAPGFSTLLRKVWWNTSELPLVRMREIVLFAGGFSSRTTN